MFCAKAIDMPDNRKINKNVIVFLMNKKLIVGF